MSYCRVKCVAMHQPWFVSTFAPSVVKPLGITVKKAVEKLSKQNLNNMSYGRVMLRSNAPAMARLDFRTQCS
jgi:hypothetical protein